MSRGVNLISKSEDGHRGKVNAVLRQIFAEIGVDLAPGRPDYPADFFAMLDDDVAGFVRTAILNSLSGRRTAALFLRPHQCFLTSSLKYRLKRGLFQFLRILPRTEILTIVPFYANPNFAKVASGWIYDPQFWDLDYVDIPELDSQLADQVKVAAGGRRILVALGGQNELKGFDFFCRLWIDRPDLRNRYLFVVGGKISRSLSDLGRMFELNGGYLIDRQISDEELFALYRISDVVWACYHPSYDQASGIFGRSFQLGRCCAVRAGSYLQILSEHLGHDILALPYNDIDAATMRLSDLTSPSAAGIGYRRRDVTQMRREDVDRLLSALGVSS